MDLETMKPKYSFIIPNWNENPWLKYCLRSLRDQTFQNFEAIIIDGGSTDGSYEYCVKFCEKHPKFKVVVDKTKNIGYIRNEGSVYANGDYIFQTSSDIWFEPDFLERLTRYFNEHPKIQAVGGRTVPYGKKIPVLCHVAYGAFDFIRFFMTCRLIPFKKFRPAGNFMCIKRKLFWSLGGYPEVKINEDGLFGQKLDEYWRTHRHKSCCFSLKFKVYHHVKRFNKGGIRGMLFYIYVFRLVFPFLKPLLEPIEKISAERFSSRSDLG